MKQKVHKYFNRYEVLDGKVADVIENLKGILENYPDAEIDVSYDGIEIHGTREETDEEYGKRLTIEAGKEAKEKAQRRLQWLTLKEEFGG